MSGGGGALSVQRSKRGKASKRKKMKRVGFTLDMTPLVDITFLLLTFFMFTTTMAAPQIMEMSIPPEVKVQVEVKESELLTILVDDSARIFWYPAREPLQPIKLKDIKGLSERENVKPDIETNKLIVLLKVSELAPYDLVVSILDQLNLAEVAITAEIAKKLDADGKPTKRQRRFTLVNLSEEDYKKLAETPQ